MSKDYEKRVCKSEKEEAWRWMSPIQDRLPPERLGQYVGPIPLGKAFKVGGACFRFEATGGTAGTPNVQVNGGDGHDSSCRDVPLGEIKVWAAGGLEIHVLPYFLDGETIRCSILVNKG